MYQVSITKATADFEGKAKQHNFYKFASLKIVYKFWKKYICALAYLLYITTSRDIHTLQSEG